MDRLASANGAVGQGTADIGVAITATPNPVAVGRLVTFDVTIRNNGPDAATDVAFAGSLSSVDGEVVGLIESAGSGCSLVPPTVGAPPVAECAVGPLASGAIRTFQIRARSNALGLMRFSGRAVDVATFDNVVANDQVTVDVPVVDSVSDVGIVAATPSVVPALIGKPMQITLVGRNFGPASAEGARFLLSFASATSVTAISATTDRGTCTPMASGLQCNVAVLPVTTTPAAPAGAAGDWTVTVTVTPTVLGDLTALARIESNVTDTAEENNNRNIRVAVTDRGQVDLAVLVQDAPDPIAIGDVLTYTIPITNGGPDSATQLTLQQGFVDRSGVELLTATSPGGPCTISAGDPAISCALGTLPAGGATSVTVTLKPIALGTITTAVLVDSYELDAVEENNRAQQTTLVVAATGADMGVTITDFPDPVDAGAELLYTVDVTNHGPQTAHDATLQFVIQGDITNVQTTTPGCAVVGQLVSCLFPTMQTGHSIPVTVTGRPTTPGGILNAVAQVDANENDSNEANDRDTEPTTVRGSTGVDLGTDISDDPDPVLAGTNFEYTVRWYNAGDTTASQADATFVIPPEAIFLSFTTEGLTPGAEFCEYDGQTNRVVCYFEQVTPARVIVVKVLVQSQDLGGGPNEQIYTMTAAGFIDSRAETDSFEENDIDYEPTTVYVCRSDNPCVTAELQPGSGGAFVCHYSPNNGVACDAPCYDEGVCVDGMCQLGAAVTCPASQVACQESQCNPLTDACEPVNVDDGTACVGDDLCVTGTTCVAGQCQGGEPKGCPDDGNVCTVASCDSVTGACVTSNTTLACDDDNPCTTYDKCTDGACVGGPTLTCNDGNPCTDDTCDPTSENGCVFTPNTAPCNDDNPCTTESTCNPATVSCEGTSYVDCSDLDSECSAGACDPSTGLCVGQAINDFVPCDDGNACTGNPCDAVADPYGPSKTYDVSDAVPFNSADFAMSLWMPGFFCGAGAADAQVYFSFEPGAKLVVDDAHNATMTGVVKVTHTGGGPGQIGMRFNAVLHFAYRGQGFDAAGSGGPKLLLGGLQTADMYGQWEYYNTVDGLLVNVADPSDQVVLVERPEHGVYPFQMGWSASGKNLNFGASVWFFFTRSGGACESAGDADIFVDLSLPGCPTIDRCEGGECKPGEPVTCDDGDLCTNDWCYSAQGCQHDAVDCSGMDTECATYACAAANGQCEPTFSSSACDDQDPCTTDACDESTGSCTHEPVTCNDSDSCTTDACVAGACVYTPVTCNDQDSCTTDACVDGECVYTPVTCNDSDSCTT
ncbi:MAG: hypothetical protein CVU56_10100, partial [Deltaproteobacteria bacterium HGW-Deltaproteobacteria-14]